VLPKGPQELLFLRKKVEFNPLGGRKSPFPPFKTKIAAKEKVGGTTFSLGR